MITAQLLAAGLTITIPYDVLKKAAELAPFAHSLVESAEGGFEVTDPVLFAQSILKSLLAERGDEGSILHAALDDAIEYAVDDAAPGWKWPRAGIHGD